MSRIAPVLLLLAACAQPAASSPSAETVDVPSLLARAQVLVAKGWMVRKGDELWSYLSREEGTELRRIESTLSAAAWATGPAMLQVLREASARRHDDAFLEWVELHALRSAADSTTAMEDPAAVNALATMVIEEEDSRVLRVHLSVLRRHAWNVPPGWRPPLGSETLARLMVKWGSAGGAENIFHITARHYLLELLAKYGERDEASRTFVLAKVMDRSMPPSLRAHAIDHLPRDDAALAGRLDLARRLVSAEDPPEVRKAAAGLAWPQWFAGPLEGIDAEAAFALLKAVAEGDPHPDVRVAAIGGILSFDDQRATGWLTAALKSEQDPKVRARMLNAFPLLGYENREVSHATQELLVRLFETETDEDVRQAAILRYLRRVWDTLVDREGNTATFDPTTLDRILRVVDLLKRKPPGPITRKSIRLRLENDFERRLSGLTAVPEYAELKRFLGE